MSSQGSIQDGRNDAEGVAPPTTTKSTLSRDTVFFALSNQRRRYVLHYLQGRDGPVRLRDLTEQIAAWENDVPVEEVAYKQRKTVYTSLRQTHVPMLQKVGIVEFNPSGDNITLTDLAAELYPYLDAYAGSEGFPWWRVYLGIGVAATVLVVTVWAEVAPFALVPEIVVAALVAGSVTATALVQSVVGENGQS